MMATRSCPFLVVALSLVGLRCGAQPSGGSSGPVVSALVAEVKYCLGQPRGMSLEKFKGISLEKLPADAVTLRLLVRLTYRNETAATLILPSTEVPRVVLSRSLEEVTSLKNQTVIEAAPWLGPLDMRELDVDLRQPVRGHFRSIPPNSKDSWRTETVELVVHSSVHVKGAQELLGKSIYLQLDLSHAMLPVSLVPQLRKKWQSYGTLWTGKARTQPLALAIPQSPAASQCDSLLRLE